MERSIRKLYPNVIKPWGRSGSTDCFSVCPWRQLQRYRGAPDGYIYGLAASTATISRVTGRILPLIQEWRSRPLERVYPFVWLDAIYYKVRHEGRGVTCAVYCIIGLNREGYVCGRE
ncbi:hypothetical protein HHL17_09690 [Chitinophaga sp. G-6-1-13]|uniref:Mutator family transposase n=1 Tax=Chitinophaga fulva TaxID=2728842 RepID=A0A848GKX6_9BACT|nr:hypothetical protein [Chitinophaga fulva]